MQSYAVSLAALAEKTCALFFPAPVAYGSTRTSRYERRSQSSSSSRTLLIALPTVLGVLLIALLVAIWYRRRRLLAFPDLDDHSIAPYTESQDRSGAPTRDSTLRRAATRMSCASATGETKECDAASVELGYQTRRDILHLLRWADGNGRSSRQGPPPHPPPSKPLPALPPAGSIYEQEKSPISPSSPYSPFSPITPNPTTPVKAKVEKKRSWRQSLLRRSSSLGTLRRSRRENTPPPELPTYDPSRAYRNIPPLLLSPSYTPRSPDSPFSLSSFLSAVSPRSPIRPLPPLPTGPPHMTMMEPLLPNRSSERLQDMENEPHVDDATLASSIGSATDSEKHRIEVVKAIDDAAAADPPPYAWPGARQPVVSDT
ncbi:hypothetical protein PENSPDRAFT_754702 [Peniophora sp. CONT]|nr:hypothetical protein PENSPDRAFT_754702 [Peniophora sp. CONT]